MSCERKLKILHMNYGYKYNILILDSFSIINNLLLRNLMH